MPLRSAHCRIAVCARVMTLRNIGDGSVFFSSISTVYATVSSALCLASVPASLTRFFAAAMVSWSALVPVFSRRSRMSASALIRAGPIISASPACTPSSWSMTALADASSARLSASR